MPTRMSRDKKSRAKQKAEGSHRRSDVRTDLSAISRCAGGGLVSKNALVFTDFQRGLTHICQLGWLPMSFYFALAGGTMPFIRRYSTIWP